MMLILLSLVALGIVAIVYVCGVGSDDNVTKEVTRSLYEPMITRSPGATKYTSAYTYIGLSELMRHWESMRPIYASVK